MGLHSNLYDDHCISKIHHHNYLYHVHHGHHNNDQEVFTDMSVLPLVFPDNMSCFSRGSYKVRICFEEFASFNVLLVLSMGIIVWMRKLPGVLFCHPDWETSWWYINRCDDIDNLSGGARSEETVAGASDATEGAAGHRQVGGQRLRWELPVVEIEHESVVQKNDKWSLHWDVVWRGWGGKLVISHLQEGAITLSTMMRFKQMLGQSRDGLLDDDCSDQIRTMLAGCNQNHHRCLIDSRGLVWERRINHTLVENYRLDKAEIFSWSSSYGLVMSEPLIWNWPFQIRIQLMFFLHS